MSQLINVIYLHSHSTPLDVQSPLPALASQKRIELHLGDLVEARTDLIVCSSSAGRYFPSGQVIKSIKRYFNISLTKENVLPLKRPQLCYNSGTWISNDELSSGQSLLITAIPELPSFSEGFGRHFDTLIGVLDELDQSVLCSEPPLSTPINIPPPLSVALPILGGNRSYDKENLMKHIIDQCSALLKRAQYLEVIQLYVYYYKEVFEWSEALEKVLRFDKIQGLYPFKERCTFLSKLLQKRIKDLSRLPQSQVNNLRQEVLSPLYQHLKYDPPCVSTLSTFARKSWEAVVLSYMNVQVGQKNQSQKMTGQFFKLLAYFQEQRMADAWISLSIVKEFGNAAVHMQGAYRKDSLNTSDYPILLYTLSRVLGLVDPFRGGKYDQLDEFYLQWSEELQEKLIELRQSAQQYSLDLDSFVHQPLQGRRAQIIAWLDQLMTLDDPDGQSEYWAVRVTQKTPKDILKLIVTMTDQCPKWISVYLYIWSLEKIDWTQGNQKEIQIYDLLSRWRLLTFIKQKYSEDT